MRRCDYDEMPAPNQVFRRPFEFVTVPLDVFQDIDVQDRVVQLAVRDTVQGADPTLARGRERSDPNAFVELTREILVRLEAHPASMFTRYDVAPSGFGAENTGSCHRSRTVRP